VEHGKGWVGGLGIPTLSCLIKGGHGSGRLNGWLDSMSAADTWRCACCLSGAVARPPSSEDSISIQSIGRYAVLFEK
jgi:hypothetical protein